MTGRTQTPAGSSASAAPHSELLRVIRQVRRRWRLRHALRGTAIALAAACLVFVGSASGIERFGFSAAAVTAFRALAYGAVLAAAVWYVLLPLLRRVSDQRVALYLEEHEPALNSALLSAIELGSLAAGSRPGSLEPRAGRRDGPGGAGRADAAPASADASPALLHKVVEDALDACHALDDGRAIERSGLRRSSALLGAAAVVALVVLVFSPAPVREGASLLVTPWTPVQAAPALRIAVEPGDVTVARGADQAILARLDGFATEPVELVARATDAAEYQRWPMLPEDDGEAFRFMLFNIARETEYFVEAGGVRSPAFRISVAELPYVADLALEYRYPAYTGLQPQTVDPGGDIAAVRGTEVRLRATTTMPVAGGSIVIDDGQGSDASRIDMRLEEDGTLTGSLRVERDGYYRIELQSARGRAVPGSPDYVIDMLEDRPPSVWFVRPGRDTRMTAIDEVFVEAGARDDFGIAQLDLFYAVNGGPEQQHTLYSGGSGRTQEITAGHTFYLEEYDLEPGDIVAYYARARDGNRVDAQQEATSDIYFIEVRPFSRDYRQAEQGGGADGGGGQNDMDGLLSQRQRELIAATFNVQRDHERYDDDDFAETMGTLGAAQARLREQVETLLRRMANRQVDPRDSSFHRIMQILPEAARSMSEAETELQALNAAGALPAEQQALQHLLRAEAVYEDVRVSFEQGGDGGGGGGQANRTADDLADLFELELDQLRNQYETVQRAGGGAQAQTQAEVDEALERLRELARRQQQELERTRRRLAMPPNMQGGGAGSQRELAEEIEQEARRLERLSRETRSQQLAEAARQMQEAADALRRSAAAPGQRGLADATAAASRLDDARRQLQRDQDNRLRQEADDAVRRAQQLAEQQRDIADGTRRLAEQGAASPQDRRALAGEQQRVGAGLENLGRQLNRLGAAARRDEQLDAARRFQDAANSIEQDALTERMIFYGRAIIGSNPGSVTPALDQIAGDLDELRRRVEAAADAIGQTAPRHRAADDMERARELIRGLESLDERQRERVQQAEEAQRRLATGRRADEPRDSTLAAGEGGGRRLAERPGGVQDGQAGGQGDPGEPGQQGQPGAGQSGGQGETAQPGQQGQQGQEGQGQAGGQGQTAQPGQPGQGQTQGGEQGQGQPGERAEAGQPGDGAARGGPGNPAGAGGGPGWYDGSRGRAPGPVRPFTDDEIRQYRSEYRERFAQAEELLQSLAREGQDVGELERLIGRLRELDRTQLFDDPDELRRLQLEVIDGFKEFEFALRRDLGDTAGQRLYLGGSDDVPAGFRPLVEEYYRALSGRRR